MRGSVPACPAPVHWNTQSPELDRETQGNPTHLEPEVLGAALWHSSEGHHSLQG